MLGPEDFEVCSHSGMMRYECAHCTGDKLGDESPARDRYTDLEPTVDEDFPYEIVGRAFEASYRGHCNIVYEHKIKVGEKVARVRRADNPMIVVGGVACKICIREIPRAVG